MKKKKHVRPKKKIRTSEKKNMYVRKKNEHTAKKKTFGRLAEIGPTHAKNNICFICRRTCKKFTDKIYRKSKKGVICRSRSKVEDIYYPPLLSFEFLSFACKNNLIIHYFQMITILIF